MALAATAKPRVLPRILCWPRLRFTLGVSAILGLVLGLPLPAPAPIVMVRAILIGLWAMLVFGVFERWPRRLPRRLSRSVLQLLAIAFTIPFVAGFAHLLTIGEEPQDSKAQQREFMEYVAVTFTGVLFAPWIAVGAMLKQRDMFAREQALQFELEKSELERNVLDGRLRLLQAQVEPHFLFNTLANVQALVDAGSPQASRVLASLIAYLRAAVSRLHQPGNLGQELDLVRAYLELMQMRMPDRLQFALHIEPAANAVQCPPMTLLTLVENSVRHGIDPSEEGGRIDIDVWLRDGRCMVRVQDTGVGFEESAGGLGTGLSTLRERLHLAFAGDAQLRLAEIQPHGVCVELDFPARQTTS